MCSEQHVCGEHVSETLTQEAFQRGADERLHVLVNAVQKWHYCSGFSTCLCSGLKCFSFSFSMEVLTA